MNNQEILRKKYWSQAAGWTLLIYGTLYLIRPVCDFVKKTTPFELISDIGLLIFLLWVIIYFFKNNRIKHRSTYLFIFLILSLYLYGISVIEYPEEKLHFIEYGILAFLIFRAARIDLSEGNAYLAAFVLNSLLGWGDEGIQHLLPNRYYQFSDVVLNCLSGALGLLLVFTFRREQKV